MLPAGTKAPLAKEDELVEEEEEEEVKEKPPLPTSKSTKIPIPSTTATTSSTTRIFGPERVLLQQQPTIKVASVSVGNFHTVVLSADNQATFQKFIYSLTCKINFLIIYFLTF
jgi:hypothetical protein